MNISRKIQHLILWVMLAVVGVAYTGKALHTHSDSYYDSLRTTRSAASNGMSDDCPICHFNLLLFLFNHCLNRFQGSVTSFCLSVFNVCGVAACLLHAASDGALPS